MASGYDPLYVAWVQRSLNRLIGTRLVTNGADTPVYREWVKFFQKLQKECKRDDGKVDEATQNVMIKAVHNDRIAHRRIYLQWVKQALIIWSPGAKFALDGYLTPDTQKAIKAFQSEVDLKPDGWVGYKTEKVLTQLHPDPIPGEYHGEPTPLPPPPRTREDDYLENNPQTLTLDQLMALWINLYLRELEAYRPPSMGLGEWYVTRCMLKKLAVGTLDYKYLEMQRVVAYVNADPSPTKLCEWPNCLPADFAYDARDDLRGRIGKFPVLLSLEERYRRFKEEVNLLYLRIDKGLFWIKQMVNASGSGSGKQGPAWELDVWYNTKMADPSSIISCFPESNRGV
jgi:peptidoglycan hydrolase-like protein with peptidoglycan-binding domain